MGDDEAKATEREFPLFFGKWASPADLKKTFWDRARVKHDPEDQSSKDWANSEPDPTAP